MHSAMELVDVEMERKARIAVNKAKLSDLGLAAAAAQMSAAALAQQPPKERQAPRERKSSEPKGPPRRSAREREAVDYRGLDGPDARVPGERRAGGGGTRGGRLTEEEVQALLEGVSAQGFSRQKLSLSACALNSGDGRTRAARRHRRRHAPRLWQGPARAGALQGFRVPGSPASFREPLRAGDVLERAPAPPAASRPASLPRCRDSTLAAAGRAGV